MTGHTLRSWVCLMAARRALNAARRCGWPEASALQAARWASTEAAAKFDESRAWVSVPPFEGPVTNLRRHA